MSAIGIDLGTTNSAAAIVEGGESQIIDIDSERTMRSVVTFAEYIDNDEDAVIVGNQAVGYLETDADKTVSAIKREMGNDHPIEFDGYDTTLTPEMVSGLILKKVAKAAEDHPAIIEEPNDAVITVPARFSMAARRCTEAAALYAYLDNVYMLLPEPSAACVAYDVESESEEVEKVAVYDLGGGTFDISIVNIVPDEEAGNQYVVDANGGKQKLGGEDFDERLQQRVLEEFEDRTGIDLSDDEEQLERVRRAAKDAKEKLSKAESAKVNVPFVAEGENVKQDITREEFEDLTENLVEETMDICEDLIDDQGYSPEDIDTVLAVGGSTKMPQVQRAIEDFFGQSPAGGVNPDEAVALGAAVQANYFDERAALPDSDAGEETDDRDALPAEKGSSVSGAAPEDIGFELASGKMEVLIEEGSNYPTEGVGTYTTVVDNQTNAQVRIFRSTEGEAAPVAEDNEHMETFVLENIREAPAGEPDLKVRFALDESGILRAEAWDESIGKEDLDGTEISFGGGDEESSSDDDKAYSPPTPEEIKAQRDDLPPVK